MSGHEIALLAVGALAVIASAGVVVLRTEVRLLRTELSAAMPARGPAPAQTGSSDRTAAPAATGSEDPSGPAPGQLPALPLPVQPVAAPSQQQIVVATLGHPLVRVAAVSHGLRRALTPENRDRILALVRRDLRRREKLRRRAARRAARVMPTSVRDQDLAL